MSFVIIIDPTHSHYPPKIDDFEATRATFIDDTEQKAITLRLAKKISAFIEAAKVETTTGKPVEVHLSRQSDDTPCRKDRANFAQTTGADIYLSLQFNNFDSNMRGTQAWIDRKYHDGHKLKIQEPATYSAIGPGHPSSGVRNTNHRDDAHFASAVAMAAYSTIRRHDPDARLLSATYYQEHHGENYLPPPGVKMKALEVLRENAIHFDNDKCLGCVLQLDFIDHPVVDSLFKGNTSDEFEDELASEIARAVIRCLN